MSGFSTFLANNLLDHVFRGDTGGTDYSQPANVYLSMHTTDPTDAGSGAEVSGGSYARKLVTFSAASGSALINSNTLTFSNFPTTVVTHLAIWDATTSGNMLISTSITSISFNSGDSATVNPGAITVTFD